MLGNQQPTCGSSAKVLTKQMVEKQGKKAEPQQLRVKSDSRKQKERIGGRDSGLERVSDGTFPTGGGSESYVSVSMTGKLSFTEIKPFIQLIITLAGIQENGVAQDKFGKTFSPTQLVCVRLMGGEVLRVIANEYCPEEIHSVDGSHNMHTIDMHRVEGRTLRTLQEMRRSCAVGPVGFITPFTCLYPLWRTTHPVCPSPGTSQYSTEQHPGANRGKAPSTMGKDSPLCPGDP
ncbi:hypothetical protein MJT46_017799 [Ovis ammon polii x Ovis aries]|nr:hypothetical protein MJT46_017799 [Ovis ammon polii x Ovis aries]